MPGAMRYTGTKMKNEFKRRVRIGIGNYLSLSQHYQLMFPRYGWVAFFFINHKLLRWFTPQLLILVLLSNVILAPPICSI